jgi:hypothetical protein
VEERAAAVAREKKRFEEMEIARENERRHREVRSVYIECVCVYVYVNVYVCSRLVVDGAGKREAEARGGEAALGRGGETTGGGAFIIFIFI